MSAVRIPDDWDLIEAIGDLEAQEIRCASHWTDDLVERARNGKQILGDKMPWSKTEFLFRFRPYEVTVWGGMNGHMKSLISGQCALWLAQHTKVFIASLEMKPLDTLDRMAFQSAGCKRGESWSQRFGAWLKDRVYIYDQLDSIPPDRILGAIYYAAKTLGCKHIFVDSLAKSGTADDPVTEKAYIDRLGWAAKNLGVHIHLIAHVRKPQNAGEEYRPTKFDVKGTSSIVDLVDNLLLVWKDKKRAALRTKIETKMPLTDKEQDYYEKSCDMLLTVGKQRHGDWEGEIALYFNRDSLQFVERKDAKALPFDLV